jgi:hypothetical protein
MSKDTPTFQTKAVVTPYHPGMTLRQYAAIKLKVPDSGLDWLDAMIVQSLRDDFAMLGANMDHCPLTEIYEVADIMLKARWAK